MYLSRISRLQFYFMMIWLVMGSGILTLPWAISQFVLRDSWLSSALIVLSPLVAAGVSTLYVRTFPQTSLIQAFNQAFGPWLGRVFGLWFLIALLISVATILREMTVFLEITVLPSTPLYVLGALVAIPILFATWSGIEVIARLAEVFTPFAVIITVFLVALTAKHMNFSHLLPVFADGWTPILRGAVVPWTFALESLLSLQLIEHLPDPRKYLAMDLMIVGGLLAVMGVMAEIIITGILGSQRIYSSFPILELVRSIRIGQFLERLDPIYVMGVITLIVLKGAIFQYTWVLGIQQLFKLQDYRFIVGSSSLLAWASSIFLFRDGGHIQEFMLFCIGGYFFFTFILLPIFTIITFRLRKKFVSAPPSPSAH